MAYSDGSKAISEDEKINKRTFMTNQKSKSIQILGHFFIPEWHKTVNNCRISTSI